MSDSSSKLTRYLKSFDYSDAVQFADASAGGRMKAVIDVDLEVALAVRS